MAMAMSISSLKPCHLPFKTRIPINPPQFTSSSPTKTTQSFNSRLSDAFPALSSKKSGFPFGSRNNLGLGFALKAQNSLGQAQGQGEGESDVSIAEIEAFGQSSTPERFKHLNTLVPRPYPWWPFFLAVTFLIYAWRTVLWEVGNWRKVASAIIRFLGYPLKVALALVADPIAFVVRGIETAIYTVRAFYSGVVAYAPIQDLTLIIVLASIVLAIAESAVPDSINSQPYLMTVAGLVGFAAVRGFISEPFFWTVLLGLFGFSRFIKKRDYVSSTLPVAAVLAAVGEPWVRFIVMASYLALAITHHSSKPSEEKEREATTMGNRVPFPLLCAALAIGLRVAAKWAGYRHLTWMIV